MNQRNRTVDFVKYVACLLIICIHTDSFSEINENLNFFFVDILCRLAVPFFAICSGYFFGLKKAKDDNSFKLMVLKQFKKLSVLYLILTVLYLVYSIPQWINTGWFSKSAFIDYAIAAIKLGSHYHLWYILSLIYALPMFYIVLKLVKNKTAVISIAVVLWAIKVISYGYLKWMPSSVSKIITTATKTGCVWEALVCILPLLLVGFYVSQIENNKKSVFYLVGLLISFVLLCVEAFSLKACGQEAVSFIFMTLPTSYFLFNLILKTDIKIPKRICVTLGEISLLVYCIHPMFSEVIANYADNSLIHWAVTAVITTLVSLLYISVKRKLMAKVHNN